MKLLAMSWGKDASTKQVFISLIMCKSDIAMKVYCISRNDTAQP
jgi:hypothetical protein